jgi:transcriptional regulator with XRE-family HTH domain
VKGTKERDRIERELESLRIGLKLRTAREQQKLTQNELAQRINKKRTFISKVENDGENITLKTLYEIVELGLGGKLNISFEF